MADFQGTNSYTEDQYRELKSITDTDSEPADVESIITTDIVENLIKLSSISLVIATIAFIIIILCISCLRRRRSKKSSVENQVKLRFENRNRTWHLMIIFFQVEIITISKCSRLTEDLPPSYSSLYYCNEIDEQPPSYTQAVKMQEGRWKYTHRTNTTYMRYASDAADEVNANFSRCRCSMLPGPFISFTIVYHCHNQGNIIWNK